jgi:hypothetical protein
LKKQITFYHSISIQFTLTVHFKSETTAMIAGVRACIYVPNEARLKNWEICFKINLLFHRKGLVWNLTKDGMGDI